MSAGKQNCACLPLAPSFTSMQLIGDSLTVPQHQLTAQFCIFRQHRHPTSALAAHGYSITTMKQVLAFTICSQRISRTIQLIPSIGERLSS
eukprot:3194591-Rhodomonas_salina.1